MADWKGTFVTITLDNAKTHVEPFEIDTYLDSDTMSDIFKEYPPANGWQIVINLHDREKGG